VNKTRFKIAVFCVCSSPLALIGVDGARGELTKNPVEEVLNRLGFWTLFLLCATLVPTPLKNLVGWKRPLVVRRMLGLFAFAYSVMHAGVYLVLDQGLDWEEIVNDLTKRVFIWVGFLALVLMIPLAMTSTSGWVRRIGHANWKRLHRLVYVCAALGVIHFTLRVKADYTDPGTFALVLAALLVARLLPARFSTSSSEHPG
jgi:sulfoxide reductase heme-binding subunit YedZ